jgi:hypothetical protein
MTKQIKALRKATLWSHKEDGKASLGPSLPLNLADSLNSEGSK